MAERGVRPKVPAWRLKALRAVRAFFTPLMPDDYLELINPLWSTQELRGRIERIERETADAVTVLIKPGWEWEGHRPGQYLRVGFAVDADARKVQERVERSPVAVVAVIRGIRADQIDRGAPCRQTSERLEYQMRRLRHHQRPHVTKPQVI